VSLLIIRHSPPTPESNSPAKSSPNVSHHAMPDDTPDPELSHEPSIRFHCPSSRDSSLPRSDSSIAGSIAEDDLDDDVDDDDLEALRQVAEGSPSPTHFRLQAPTDLTKQGKSTDQDAHSHMEHNGQNSLHFATRNGVGDSEHNPIQLDNDIRVQGVVVDESDDEEFEATMNPIVRLEHQAVPLPYMLETAAVHGQLNDSTVDIGDDSDEFDECSDDDGIDQVIHKQEKESKVYQSTYVEADEEDEYASSSIAETEDEGIVPSKTTVVKADDEDDQKGSANHPGTLQSRSYPALLVDHAQCQTHGVPEASASPMDGSYSSFPLHDIAVPGHSKISERAPSPSDAALAKTSSAKDSQPVCSPSERYNQGQNATRALQNIHNDSTWFTENHTVTSTEDFMCSTPRDPPSINYRISPEYNTNWTTWQVAEQDQTHYSDGPFRPNANRVPALSSLAGSAPNPLPQGTASNSQIPGLGGTYLSCRAHRAPGTYDRSLNEDKEEISRQPGHGDLPANPYSHTSINRLGSAISYAASTSACEAQDQPDSSPATTRPTTGLSIGDIVETRSTRSPTPVLGTKRKADEISTDQDDSISSARTSQSSEAVSNPDDFCLPDAQPRDASDLSTQLKSTQSTDTSLGPSHSTVQIATRDRRPKKRVKTVAKWIGTTILLGVSAVVTIAATAPQSVWDEIDREMGLA